MIGVGEAAALATALLWSGCVQFFGAAGMRIGSVAVNHLRLPAALLILTALHLWLLGQPMPTGLASRDVLLFVLSGIVGLSLGDASSFQGLVLVGPSVVTLISTLVPAIATLEALVFLGEPLRADALLGMAVTLCGLGLALWSRLRGGAESGPLVHATSGRAFVLGVLLALGGAVGQATGVVLAKPALLASNPLSGTWVRMLAAMVALWAWTGVRWAWTRTSPWWWGRASTDGRAQLLVLGGVLTGPTFGVWLSLIATKHADVSVATTLMSLTPIIVLLAEWPLRGRRPRFAELLGAALAITGVAMLVGLL